MPSYTFYNPAEHGAFQTWLAETMPGRYRRMVVTHGFQGVRKFARRRRHLKWRQFYSRAADFAAGMPRQSYEPWCLPVRRHIRRSFLTNYMIDPHMENEVIAIIFDTDADMLHAKLRWHDLQEPKEW